MEASLAREGGMEGLRARAAGQKGELKQLEAERKALRFCGDAGWRGWPSGERLEQAATAAAELGLLLDVQARFTGMTADERLLVGLQERVDGLVQQTREAQEAATAVEAREGAALRSLVSNLPEAVARDGWERLAKGDTATLLLRVEDALFAWRREYSSLLEEAERLETIVEQELKPAVARLEAERDGLIESLDDTCAF